MYVGVSIQHVKHGGVWMHLKHDDKAKTSLRATRHHKELRSRSVETVGFIK